MKIGLLDDIRGKHKTFVNWFACIHVVHIFIIKPFQRKRNWWSGASSRLFWVPGLSSPWQSSEYCLLSVPDRSAILSSGSCKNAGLWVSVTCYQSRCPSQPRSGLQVRQNLLCFGTNCQFGNMYKSLGFLLLPWSFQKHDIQIHWEHVWVWKHTWVYISLIWKHTLLDFISYLLLKSLPAHYNFYGNFDSWMASCDHMCIACVHP